MEEEILSEEKDVALNEKEEEIKSGEEENESDEEEIETSEGKEESESDEEESEVNESDEMKKENLALSNEIQKNYETTNELLYVCLVAVLFCFGVFLFIYFLPITFEEKAKIWRNFSNNCCYRIQNETRCLLNHGCKYMLNCWIELQNSSRNFIPECCYWFSPYEKKELLLHCNPHCIR